MSNFTAQHVQWQYNYYSDKLGGCVAKSGFNGAGMALMQVS